MSKESLTLAAVGDIHCGRTSEGRLAPLFEAVAGRADVLLLAGDLTDYGLPEEARLLLREVRQAVDVPVVAVLGNHDYESGRQDEVRAILNDGGIIVLDGDTCVLHGVGFVGVKGFGGGFGRRMLEPWGEPAIKAFVHDAVEEALRLESGLAKLRTSARVALLHYAPIEATVLGEPPEIFAFLGSSRLEDPLDRYDVTACFHGHAHHGTLEGRTRDGVPVYNVAAPLLRRSWPGQPPFRFVTVQTTEMEE